MTNIAAMRRLFAGLRVNDEAGLQNAKAAFANLILDDRIERTPCHSDPELWWSTDKRETAIAKKACAELCPLRVQCLAYALAAKESDGVWGGLDHDERRNAERRIKDAARRQRKNQNARTMRATARREAVASGI